MTLPFVPTIVDGEKKVNKSIKNFFSPDVRDIDVLKEFPSSFSKIIGQPSLRGFAAVASGLQSIGQRVLATLLPGKTLEEIKERTGFGAFKPTGTFQKELFGTEEEITAGEFGREIRGEEEDKELKIDPFLGFAVGFVDVIPGGKPVKPAVKAVIAFSKTLKAKLFTRYGKTIAKQIEETGDENFGWSALIKGGEDAVANKLNISRVDVASQKLADSFKDIAKAQKLTEAVRTTERAKRAGVAEKLLQKGEGRQAFISAKASLKGELPKGGLAPAAEARLTTEDVDIMFNQIRTSPDIQPFNKITAGNGLGKILGDPFFEGAIPTKSEIKLLKQIFGAPFVEQIERSLTVGQKISETVAQVANVPRALMASMDMSAPLRQGLLLAVERPKDAAKAFKEMFKFFQSPKYFDAAMDSIQNSKMNSLRKSAGLELTDVSGQASSLSKKEEGFMSDLAARIPGIGILVRASERAFVGFLNKLRADVFDDVAKEYMAGGLNPSKDMSEFKGLAKFVNTATGRGDFGGKLKEAAPLLNSVFFSPRFLASRLQMFNPQFYFSLPPQTRKLAVKSFLKLMATGAGIASLAKLAGADVELDPKSSDFGKIRIGKLRFDIWGGFQQWFVFATRLLTGESKGAISGKVRKLEGDVFGGTSRLDVVNRFFQGKLAPVPGLAADLLRGQTIIGEELSLSDQALNKLVPLYMQDIIEVAQEEGLTKSLVTGVPAFFGVGSQFFDAPKTRLFPELPQLPTLPKFPKLPKI